MREPQLCVTVTGKTMEDLRRARDAAAQADLVEGRLAGGGRPDGRGRGGAVDGSEEERERLLAAALDAGAEFVDVEARAACAPALLARRRGRGVVLSMHAFGDVPAALADR